MLVAIDKLVESSFDFALDRRELVDGIAMVGEEARAFVLLFDGAVERSLGGVQSCFGRSTLRAAARRRAA